MLPSRGKAIFPAKTYIGKYQKYRHWLSNGWDSVSQVGLSQASILGSIFDHPSKSRMSVPLLED
jgi:hypothetical protein